MDNIAIALENVSKYYKLYRSPKDRLKEALHPLGKKYHREFYAVRNLSLNIKKGEILGVVGRNGSGKSTLLKLISSVLVPNTGSVSVNGKVSALLELGAGFNPEFTGLQNIYFYATVLGIGKKEIGSRIADIVDFADIGTYIEQPLKTYSSGMKARLGFAVAIHVDPEILILDEVLAVGDALFRRKCYAKMEEYFSGGKTIIYVSHNANSINQHCTRAILLEAGEMLLEADPKSVTSVYQHLIFSSEKNGKGTREVIAELQSGKRSAVPEADRTGRISAPLNGRNKGGAGVNSGSSALFIPGFTSKSTIKIKNHDVDVIEPAILTLNGEQVNSLLLDERYVYTFNVRFGFDATEVSFGSQIKSEAGVTVSLASLNNSRSYIPHLERGIYRVEWEFDCKLMPGTYFFDTSVAGLVDSERTLFCRLKDSVVFKVQQQKRSMYAGIVSLNQTISYKQLG